MRRVGAVLFLPLCAGIGGDCGISRMRLTDLSMGFITVSFSESEHTLVKRALFVASTTDVLDLDARIQLERVHQKMIIAERTRLAIDSQVRALRDSTGLTRGEDSRP